MKQGAAHDSPGGDMDDEMPTEAGGATYGAAMEDEQDEVQQQEEEADIEAEDGGSAAVEQPAYGTPVVVCVPSICAAPGFS